MSSVVIPLTFPYKPNGGFTPSDIWGSPKPSIDTHIPDGSTQEFKKRLSQVTLDSLETVLNSYAVKYSAKPEVSTQHYYTTPSGAVVDARTGDATIKISAPSAKPNYLMAAVIALGGLMMFSLAKKL